MTTEALKIPERQKARLELAAMQDSILKVATKAELDIAVDVAWEDPKAFKKIIVDMLLKLKTL